MGTSFVLNGIRRLAKLRTEPFAPAKTDLQACPEESAAIISFVKVYTNDLLSGKMLK